MKITESSPAAGPAAPATGDAAPVATLSAEQMAALLQIWNNAVHRPAGPANAAQAQAKAPEAGDGGMPGSTGLTASPSAPGPAARSEAGELDGEGAAAALLAGTAGPAAPHAAAAGRGSGHSAEFAPQGSPTLPVGVPLAEDVLPRHGASRPEPENSDPAGEPPTLGAAMLQSLLYQSTPVAAPAPVAPAAAPAPRIQDLESVVAETVSRLLVSDPLHDGRREVRIDFAPSVLPDTHVRLWRDEGRLHVEFTSPAAVADSGLKDALPRLADAIQLRAPQPEAPLVSLRLQDGAAGQPGDGRSRQQYQPEHDPEALA